MTPQGNRRDPALRPDRDDVEPRNFSRQFLYRHADLGRSKVDRAAEWVRELDPSIEARAVER